MSDAQFFAYGRPGFVVVAALSKILVFVVLFALGVETLAEWGAHEG